MNQEVKKIIDQVRSEADIFNKVKLVNFLRKEKDFSIKRLAKIFSITPSYLCNLLRLLKLPEIVIDGYYSKTISLTHLLIISRLKTKQDMIAAYEEILLSNLNTEQTQALVREKLFNLKSEGERISQETKRKIIEKFKIIDKDFQVKLVQTRIQAKLILTIRGSLKKTTKVLKKLLAG